MSLTKEQILADFSALSLSKLQKLYEYSKYLVIPDSELLSNVTMQQMVNKANSLADALFPEWTDRSNTDFGMFLVELFALFSEKDFWYFNRFANESLLTNMHIYSAAFIKAVELGHSPVVFTSANGSFNISWPAGAATVYAPGTLVVKSESGISYTNKDSFTVALSVSPTIQAVTLYEGNLLSASLVFDGAGLFLRDKKIDPSSIRVFKDGVTEWTRVKVFGQSTSTSEHFVVIPEEDGAVSIFFGEDGYGKTPEVGNSFTVTYISCSGKNGNSLPVPFTVQKSVASRQASAVVLPAATTNGLDGESLASLKNTTLNYFTGKNTCYNVDTTEKFLNSQPEVAKSKVSILGNIVNFYVQPKDGSVASGSLLTSLENKLQPFLVNGYDLSGNSTTYVTIPSIVADIYYLKGYDENTILVDTKQLISDYTNPVVLANYGVSFNLSDLSVLLKSKIPGFQNIVFTTPTADVSVGITEILQKVPLANITLTPYAVS